MPQPNPPAQAAPAARPTLTRERVLDAAVEFADRAGADALSMRRVGEALGVEAMSLYHHVAGKDDLLDGMVDRVIAEFPRRDAALGWQDGLRHLVRGARGVLLEHPWTAGLATARPAVGPARLRFVDDVLGALLSSGCSPQFAHDAMHALEVHVFAFTLQEQRLDPGLAGRGAHLDALRDGVDSDRYPHLALTLASARHDHDAEFDLVLEILLLGLDRALDVAGRDVSTA